MRITKTGVFLLFLVIVLSITVANISNIISVNFDSSESVTFKSRNLMDDASDNGLTIGESSDHLFWFIQISDIHISIFHDIERISDLQEFCDVTVSAIQPSVVLATGDLTDAKQKDNIGSQQYDEEWKKYRKVLDNCKGLKSSNIIWLDIRGNHDNFDVPGPDSERNLYKKYSMHGSVKSYMKHVKGPSGEVYSFIGLDACPDQGLRRPFNFIGLLSEMEIEHLHQLAALSASQANYTVWFGHYPTSCILSKGSKVRDVIGKGGNSLAYLCGHLHTLGGLVPNMYTLQKQGFLELELGDWKDNRMYRVAAIDHGLLSFTDVHHKDWPVVLITNPKHVLFNTPQREPLYRMFQSTHIRVLVFNLVPLLSVRVKLDDGDWKECRKIGGPLYVVKWEPRQFSKGVHYVYVSVTDSNGHEKIVEQPFSLDGTRLSFKLLPRIFLMSNFSTLFQVMFGFSILGCVLPLCILRYFNAQIKFRKIAVVKIGQKYFDLWLRRLWVVANLDRFFYPLTLYPLYLTIGPWSVGELIHGHVGVLFAWGTFINGTYLPGAFTYAYGFFELFLFQAPLILILGHKLYSRIHKKNSPRTKTISTFIQILGHAPFMLIMCFQLALAYAFWLAYGTMALVLGPFRIWPFLITLWVWRESHAIPERKIRVAASCWLNEEWSDDTATET